MHPIVLPLLGCQRFEQGEIGFADHAKLLDRFAGIALLIMTARHPGILIDRYNGSPRHVQNQSHTKTDDDFRIGEMCENLIDRPFVRSRTLAQFGRGQALDYPLEFLCCGSLNRQRLLPFDVSCYPLNVLLRCFVHCVRLPPLCEYGTRGRHWGSHVSESHGRDNVQRKEQADYPNLAAKANQWSVMGGQFPALSSWHSALILSCQARLIRTCDQFPSNKTSAGERLCISRRLTVSISIAVRPVTRSAHMAHRMECCYAP